MKDFFEILKNKGKKVSDTFGQGKMYCLKDFYGRLMSDSARFCPKVICFRAQSDNFRAGFEVKNEYLQGFRCCPKCPKVKVVFSGKKRFFYFFLNSYGFHN